MAFGRTTGLNQLGRPIKAYHPGAVTGYTCCSLKQLQGDSAEVAIIAVLIAG